MKVFSSAIGYLKDNFLGLLQEKVTSVTESDIDWVITVPAFWNNSSIQFMTEAAEKVYLLSISSLFSVNKSMLKSSCFSFQILIQPFLALSPL